MESSNRGFSVDCNFLTAIFCQPLLDNLNQYGLLFRGKLTNGIESFFEGGWCHGER